MKELCLPLKKNWMARPYFGTALGKLQDDDAEKKEPSALTFGNWNNEGMQCCALKAFLENDTGGLFLVAGPRGIGKTSLVRNALFHWQDTHIKEINEQIKQPTNNKENLSLKEKKGRFRFQIVDAADLGLFEVFESTQLERVLILGLLRTIQDTMIPLEKRASLWQHVKPNNDDLLYRDLVSLIQVASSDSAKMDLSTSGAKDGSVKAKAELEVQATFWTFFKGKIITEAEQAKKWGEARSTQLKWSYSTDAIRAELRALFKRHKGRHWPLLVLDEWDRFEEKDTSSAKQTLDQDTAETPPNTPATPRALTASEVLKALGRIKSLLADYPAPVIVIGGEEFYKEVRRKRHRPNEQPINENLYSSIFHHQCFISPLPNWTQDLPQNPLVSYLQAICKSEENQVLKDLADYLLIEIGPNPHTLKLYLTHYISGNSDTPEFKHPKTAEMVIKILMSQTILQTLQLWQAQYSGIVPAGPYRRLCWFRYLRNRLLAYWECAGSYHGDDFRLPEMNAEIPPPRNLLLQMENMEIKQLNKTEMLGVDMQLTQNFFKCFQDRYNEETTQAVTTRKTDVTWEHWLHDKNGPIYPTTTDRSIVKGHVRHYNLKELYKQI